jgi:hypothetical protein
MGTNFITKFGRCGSIRGTSEEPDQNMSRCIHTVVSIVHLHTGIHISR